MGRAGCMWSSSMAPRTDSDAALWRRATSGVKPLAQRAEAPPTPAPPSKPIEKPPTAAVRPLRLSEPVSPPLALDRFAGIDRANAERLKRGKHKIEARLDLHGMTQDEAHRALSAFIRGARVDGKRCVLVITGRGRTGDGVLKSAVPRWLDEPELRPHVLAIAAAQPQDGGSGALYVMLRRTRAG
jgi:DNA-nicking Smr family endonuclease